MMSHEYRILERMLIEGQISRQEFKERIDAEWQAGAGAYER